MRLPTLDHTRTGGLARHGPSCRGFALPWALFTLALVSLLATTGFLLTWLDGRAAHAFARATDAFYVADAGLATALAGATGPVPTLAPVALSTGVASVTFEQLLDLGPGEKLFRIESTGRVASNGGSFNRTVGRLAWVASPPRMPGALVGVGAMIASAPSGTGYQVSLFGLLGVLAAIEEGVEVNILGLVFGIDPLDLALKLPMAGRIGFSEP